MAAGSTGLYEPSAQVARHVPSAVVELLPTGSLDHKPADVWNFSSQS